MEFHLKFVWLGKLALFALALMLASDLLLLSNLPMHLYAIYLGLTLALVVVYFVSRVRTAKDEGRRALPHVYRLLFMNLTGFALSLTWSLCYFRLEGAFEGLDMALLGPKMLGIFISSFAVKAVMLSLAVLCLADAFQRGKGSADKSVEDFERPGERS
ncbi:MAG: hypothetical protein KMY53_04745 [Desulfarculus sp.]|nr:hypothetical protein [Pseudomonadota bacterium]MBV1714950.1 hypothetical protein [Desulfarculus sp.]MBU4575232.1 hypothetical protein [Pseudomonadota bacterium]MBU4598997.1 hypothetical protein [Pseudomonadota bacterium]MBV1737450.1 hypothetical protein [Desulfarculus sp.]